MYLENPYFEWIVQKNPDHRVLKLFLPQLREITMVRKLR